MNKELFDTTIGYDDEIGVQLAEGLTAEEVEQAIKLYRLFNELWGVCIVLGKPGTGKDLFGNIIAYKLKKYFPWKRILRDEKPRMLFGEYAGLFNDKVLSTDLLRMKAVAQGDNGKNTKVVEKKLESEAEQWVTSKGEVILKNSVLYLTEYWRYCYNRDPHSPMNKTMGAIHKVKRHLDCLILGTVQLVTDLDRRTCMPFIDWRVTCNRSETNPTGFTYFIERVAYDRRLSSLLPIDKPFPMAFDAGKPRSNIGDGKIKVIKKDFQPVGRVEKKIYEALQAGVTNYEELVEGVRLDESEILLTLKLWRFTKGRRVIDYPCFFGLYNSKSAPQIKSSLKVEE